MFVHRKYSDLIAKMNFNIFDMTLLLFTIFISFLGSWINYYEKQTPTLISKATIYGNTAFKNSEANALDYIEIPKSYFRHFYTYAYLLSWGSLVYMNLVYFFNVNVNDNMRSFFDIFMKNQKPVSVTAAITSMIMLTIQCSRRLHETLFLQVFAKATRINVCHFALAIAHYTICILAILGASPLFCGTQNRKDIQWYSASSLLAFVPSVVIFLWASYEQHQSNLILASLRRDLDSSAVIREEYGMPRGRLFDKVSSPHRLTEIIIYAAMALMMQTKTYFLILVWVLSNQLQAAIGTHNWYKETYKNYRTRYALIPKVI